MAQEPYAKLEEEKFSAPKKCRCSTTYVQIVCQMSCIVLLIICVVSIERRISFLEKRLDSMAEGLKKEQSDHKGGLHGHRTPLARDKRAVRDPKTRFSSLAKQLRTLKTRTTKFSKTLSTSTSFQDDAARWNNDGQEHVEEGPKEAWLSGVVYQHWGRTSCSGDASLVYNGYMANSQYTASGGGSNFICLTNNVTYVTYPSPQEGTNIYGTKYYTSFQGFKNNLNEHLALCAVCYTAYRGSQIMVPATKECPIGWTVEYRGYLMSGHYDNHHSSEFVCVDEEAEPGGTSFGDGAVLYVVQGLCDPLSCKPFVNGRQLACVVCTK